MPKDLRHALTELRDARMLEAFQSGTPSVADDLVFPGEKSSPISVARAQRELFPTLARAREPSTLPLP